MQAIDPLLQPFQLKDLTLRNRVVSASHEPAYSEDGMPGDRYLRYHEEKARGGVGLTMIGGSAVVAPDSPPAFGNLELYRDEIVGHLRRLTDTVHEHGAAVMIQVTHLGRRTSNFAGDWLPVVYPSRLREPAHRSFPKIAEPWDLDRIVSAYADAAARCQQAGLDGIELEAYGHLLDGFLSPATNLRDDEFGGSLEQRMIFPRRVITAVREAVGPDFIVGIRMAMDEDRPDGLHTGEALTALRSYIADGIDFLSVIRGTIDRDATLAKVIPSMGTPAAPHLDFAGQIRRAIDIPVLHSARIADVATARHAIRDGLLDLVGMTRAQLADPYLVAKLEAGEEDRIRPCVGANYCLDAIYESGDAKCIHNAATGREQQLPHRIAPAAGRRTAVVVGAGPAGLEAARVLGERGHRVVVFEAADAAGGQVLLAASAARRRDLIGIIDWRLTEAKYSGVEFRFGQYADVSSVLDVDPDLVIIATGGMPDHDFLSGPSTSSGNGVGGSGNGVGGSGNGAELVHDVWDVMDGAFRARGSVLVYDDNGAEPALDATERLASRGAPVEYVTPERTLGPAVGSMNSPAYLAAFAEYDVTVTLAERLIGVRRADGRLVATLFNEYAERTSERAVDHVIVEHGTVPNDDLYLDLVAGSVNLGEVDHTALLAGEPQTVRSNPGGRYQLFRIGDAVASRNIHAAIYDALRLCHVI